MDLNHACRSCHLHGNRGSFPTMYNSPSGTQGRWPNGHLLERRVGAHLLLCQLALVIVKYVDQRVKETGLKDREGEPLTGPSAIASLRKVKAGEVELPGTGQRRIVVTKLKPPQEAILRVVGVGPERFHRGWERLL